MNIVEKITFLFDCSGKSASSILKDLALSPTALSEWKRSKAKPTVDSIIKIAKYFNVSADYLLGTEPTDEEKKQGVIEYTMTPDKEELLMLYEEIGSKLGDDAQRGLINYAKFLVDNNKKG